MKDKRLAVVASGWHFPSHFYRQIAAQKIPKGWSVDLFCISHRDPAFAEKEKKDTLNNLGTGRRQVYDRLLYEKVADVSEIQSLGWKYILEPNSIGDWGNSNQWLEKNDYKKYDKFLFTHDDNFILSDQMLMDILPQDDWLILTNTNGNAQRRLRRWLHLPKPMNIRGSFEFFTREMMDMMGGKFDLSDTSLNREGKFTASDDMTELTDWNSTVYPLTRLIKKNNVTGKIKALSPYYRMSKYCLEGERGYISHTEISNTSEEEKGLDLIDKYYKKNIIPRQSVLKVLYLFGGSRSGQIRKVRDGIQPDDHFHGVLRLTRDGLKANYLELEDVYPLWIAKIFRTFINVYFVHMPIYFKFFSYDIIFASTAYGTQLVHALLHFNKPRWVINDFGVIGRIGDGRTIAQKIFKWMVGRAGGIITLGNKEAEDLKIMFPHLGSRIVHIPFGVDTEFWKPLTITEENRIMSAGFDPGRDYSLLFEAIKDSDVDLFISKSRNIDTLAVLPHRVKTMYISWKKLVTAYAKSKIVVIPLDITGGKNDAMGTSSLVQAMAMGKAIIVTRTDTTESYITNGENGILVEKGNVSELRFAIMDLLGNPEKRNMLGRNARKFVEDNCAAEIVADKMVEFFKRIRSN